MEELNHLVIEVCGKKYTFNGGGGSGSQPAPDSVGTEEIRDGSVGMVDLDEEVKTELGGNLTEQDIEGIFYPDTEPEDEEP